MDYPSFDLKGKVAVVTGSGRGIGKGIALSMAHFGALVAVADRITDNVTEVTRQIVEMGGRAIPITVNIEDGEQINEMVDKTMTTFGGIDILVNNAGVLVEEGPAEELTSQKWDQVLNVNLKGTFFCAQAVGKTMISQHKRGKIVNIASLAAFFVMPNLSAYSVSKAGIASITKSLAIEWAKYGINVNAVAPTFVRTPMTEGLLSDNAAQQVYIKRMPLGRLGTPEDIAGAVIFLASPASNMITGQILPVDGGWLAGEILPR